MVVVLVSESELSLGTAGRRFGTKKSGRSTMRGAQRSAVTWLLIGESSADLTRLETTSRNFEASSRVLGCRLEPCCMLSRLLPNWKLSCIPCCWRNGTLRLMLARLHVKQVSSMIVISLRPSFSRRKSQVHETVVLRCY